MVCFADRRISARTGEEATCATRERIHVEVMETVATETGASDMIMGGRRRASGRVNHEVEVSKLLE